MNGKMESLKTAARIIRLPNLLIIIIGQVFLRYFIIEAFLNLQGVSPAFSEFHFYLLVLVTLLIAAAGYMINDYYDVDSDRINRPEKVVIGKKIRFSTITYLYYALNVIAGLMGFYLAIAVGFFQLGLVFIIIMIMLWYYSSRWQMKVLGGNIVVAILSGFTIYIVWLFEFFALRQHADLFIEAVRAIRMINYFVWGYFAFAFITTMIREVIKDMQDMEGDTRVGFRTLPVVSGTGAAKKVVYLLVLISIFSLGLAQYFLFAEGFRSASWFLLASVQILLVYLFAKLPSAKNSADFRFLSMVTKIIMVAGILSMQLIYLDIN